MSCTAEVLYGYEPRTAFIRAAEVTRGQAKAVVAWEIGASFTSLRCKQIWMQFRVISEDEAMQMWLPDWEPDDEIYIECKRDDPDAEAYWWLSWAADA